jgi:ABC-type transport system involved in cytochrome c biogenesis permease subunit
MIEARLVDSPELVWLWPAVGLYVLAAGAALARRRVGVHAADTGMTSRVLSALLLAAVALMAAGIAQRWLRLGHGPFVNMFEILASSLFSLGLAYLLLCRWVPLLRQTIRVVLPLLGVMALWMLATNPTDTRLPVTYDTPLLWIHVLLGKVFLGCALAALALASVVLLRKRAAGAARFAALPNDKVLDTQAWRLMLVALVFESLMLIAGAVWAQDAWGRYWDWDPLEVWAFLTWLLLVSSVHARRTWHVGPSMGAWLIVAVFVVAFLTFFGVPFISQAPHKGAV